MDGHHSYSHSLSRVCYFQNRDDGLPSFARHHLPNLKVISKLPRNYLEIKSFEIVGREEKRVRKFGKLSIVSCIALCVSTATISDGGDMNWTVHTIGATSFFVFALYMVVVASKIYR